MKVLFKIVIAVSLIVSSTSVASARDRGVNGLIIGGGAGAIMGQAVGRNVESTIIGATVGGIIGAVIGAESSHYQKKRIVIQQPAHIQHSNQYRNAPRNYHRETIVIQKQKGKSNKKYYNNRAPRKENNHR